ncbi:MAG: bifunctional adenosylcobinamide kinase/adenosylcobinamide-phosphate guanylyltransferase [Lachnospiraceae bacterium]|nr:bifunctional adenosylcobinamide kinase/adenosylcobinamide-phosphate guanylyltransferase [Lachnospiraceae bacterium]
MGRLILVTGGSRSGKSQLAEQKATILGGDDVLYMATGIATDDDMEERIRLHKLRRNPNWGTFEGYRDLEAEVRDTSYGTILLDCITVLITNFLMEEERDYDELSKADIAYIEEEIMKEVQSLIHGIKKTKKNLVIVTNEVGMSVVSAYRMGRIFSDITGKVNQILASICDEVYLSVSGIPLQIK